MDRVIFAKSSIERLPQYQILTIAKKTNGRIVFEKRAVQPGLGERHLQTILETRKIANALGLGKTLSEVSLNHNIISSPFVSGESFDDLLLTATLQNKTAVIDDLLDLYEKFLKNFTDKKVDKQLVDSGLFLQQREIFGQRLDKFFPDSPQLFPGIVDLNFDNLILTQKGLTAIDYEWVFLEPTPYDYILSRSIYWFGNRYKNLFRLFCRRMPILRFSPDIFLPAHFLKRYPKIAKNLTVCDKLERLYFQKWVRGGEKASIPTEMSVEEYKEEIRFDLENYQDAINQALESKQHLELKVTDLIQENQQLQQQLTALSNLHQSVINSKSYKITELILKPYRFLIKKLFH